MFPKTLAASRTCKNICATRVSAIDMEATGNTHVRARPHLFVVFCFSFA